MLLLTLQAAGGPLPTFAGISIPQASQPPIQPQNSGGAIRVPPLSPEKANQYAALFEQSGAQDGSLSGLSPVPGTWPDSC